jgi:hypothetical protein
MPNSGKKQKDSGMLGKVSDYATTVAKSYQKWNNLKNAPAQNPEAGQFWGAVLQNRKYNSKGQQMKK